MGHSCGTLVSEPLVEHPCGRLLWDTLVGHSCRTLLWGTFAGGHSCGTLLWRTLVGHSCRTLLWDTLVGHSCRTLLWDTLMEHLCGTSYKTLLLKPPHVSKTSVSYENLKNSHVESAKVFVGDFLQNSRVNPPKRAFRTRLAPKSHASSLQNERLVRDFLQKSYMAKSPNEHFVRDFLQKSSGKPYRSTHIKQPCQAVSPSNAHSHANPSVTATFTSTTTRNLTIPCACHEKSTSTPQKPHKLLCLPRKVTINILSCFIVVSCLRFLANS